MKCKETFTFCLPYWIAVSFQQSASAETSNAAAFGCLIRWQCQYTKKETDWMSRSLGDLVLLFTRGVCVVG